MKEEFDIREDLEIDLGSLEEEWRNQPALYEKYSTLITNHQEELEKSKLQFSITSAEVEKRIRKENADKKITEGAVKAEVQTDKQIIEFSENIISQESTIAKLKGVLRAIEHKKYALNNEVSLWLGGYFSDNDSHVKKNMKFMDFKTQQLYEEDDVDD